MSSIMTKITQKTDLGKQKIIPYINAVIMMGIFTFLFLGAEYLYDNMISLTASKEKTVLAQNYALGVSTAGFLLYPIFNRFLKKQCRNVCTILISLASIFCIFLICQHTSYVATLISGLVLFLFLGLFGSAVYYASVCMLKTDKYLARIVGISYMFGILLQFANNNFVNMETVEAVILSIFLLVLVFLLIKTEQIHTGYDEQHEVEPIRADTEKSKSGSGEKSNRTSAGILLILLVVLMTCIFSTLDNAVTLVHATGTVDIGQWPRILLALSGLAAGFVFDIKNRKFMSLIMYCVMMLSTICIAILSFGGPFLIGLFVFYMSAGFFAVFFTTAFMEISCYMKIPELWSGMGRAVNNITAAVIANGSLALLTSGNNIAVIIIALILFVAVIIVVAAYTYFQMKDSAKETVADVANDLEKKDKLQQFSESFSLTPRETEVFNRLVNTEDSIQVIAESLYISRRTLERYISAIYGKTGVKSRVGLIRIYNDN
ncbi:MAG: response regulator transcription factor [Acutalibacteraceae bacterium]